MEKASIYVVGSLKVLDSVCSRLYMFKFGVYRLNIQQVGVYRLNIQQVGL